MPETRIPIEISARHLHMNTKEAKRLGVKNGDVVSVAINCASCDIIYIYERI